MRPERLLALTILSLTTALAGSACSSYEEFELRMITSPPGDVSVSGTSVVVPQGVVVGVQLRAPGAEDPETGMVYASMRSNNPAIVGVWPTVEENTFVICGVAEGTATITVSVDGQDDETLSATVGAPKAP